LPAIVIEIAGKMPAPQNWDAPAGIAFYGKIKPGDRQL
jgi:hypothetical protein